jgi:ketosteroid isomerase-like protein
MSSNAEVLMRAFASDWGKGKPPALDGAMRPEAELIVPESMPYGGGVFRGRERIEQWFAEDLWQLWAELSSTPTDFIDGGEKIVVPVHVKGKTHDGTEVEADNVWIYEFEDGKLRRARLIADTANAPRCRERSGSTVALRTAHPSIVGSCAHTKTSGSGRLSASCKSPDLARPRQAGATGRSRSLEPARDGIVANPPRTASTPAPDSWLGAAVYFCFSSTTR